jgi:hypothetical protein
MRKFTFLETEIFYGIVGLLIFAYLRLPIGLALFISFLAVVVFWSGRRNKINFQETTRQDGEIYLSPIHGQVVSVRQHIPIMGGPEFGHEIRIVMSIWDEKGLYLPLSAEVAYLKATKGRRVSRDADDEHFYGPLDDVSRTDLTLNSKSQTKTLLRFIDGLYCRRPSIWLKSGDRGRGAACFGYYPFGGTLLIYLPKESDVLVYVTEIVKPGLTVLAAIKEKSQG